MTTSPISYNVAQNIFKYLDVEKRLQISVQCPELRTAERKADLKLVSLILDEKRINIHKKNFDLLKSQEGQDATFMLIGNSYTDTKTFSVTGHKDFLKKTLNLYLADRGRVKIEALSCNQPSLIAEYLPKDLMIQCHLLCAERNHLEMIHTFSPHLILPVEHLPIFVAQPEDPILENEVVRTARNLMIVRQTGDPLINDLLKLRNPTIQIQHSTYIKPFTSEDVMAMVQGWMTRCPPVATVFAWKIQDNEKLIEVVMDELRKKLGAVAKGGWPDEKNDAVLLMSSGHWLRINAVPNFIRIEVREKNSY